ncbi:aminotransferase-like domain-containing protein [Vagococcus hydrophili]|uniref:PLP-dependent aminotransferase family protein n=1 Tax=Vagococcus hydrophili TaxID=2714947 RepID=A0A6G8AQD6_9ENTE|nr:PLP-dependent aminotransferase family protein [Vagococcus hydrophili]QIL47216.1 PLP-dependent aminotransferase family protein [Vagococcus hydrophili]
MKYIEVYQQIKQQIQDETYQEGQKIPSLRNLAQTYNCSLETIKHAVSLLKEDQLIYTKNRSGLYVIQKNFPSSSDVNKDIIDFGSSRGSSATFPYEEFQRCLKKATENYKQEFFTYGRSQGLPELIETLHTWFESQQIYTQKENLFITTGVQQALFILSRLAFLNKKECILLENPSYHLMIELLNVEKIPYLTIERNIDGIDWTLLEYYFREKDIKFFYTTPRISSPLGLSFTESEKKQLVRLAKKYDVYIIEDDYLADFISNPTELPIHYYDISDHVIYLKSFSKIMFPGLRLGACVLPKLLVEKFKQYRKILEVDSGMFSQAALNLYIKSDLFNHHVSTTKKIQKERDLTFKEAIQNNDLFRPDLFLSSKSFITLPNSVSKTQFELNINHEQVILEDLSRHFLSPSSCETQLYGIELFHSSPETIKDGVKKIITAYEKAIKI